MSNFNYALALSTSLLLLCACGGSSSEPEKPVIIQPIVDHSGLTPLTAQNLVAGEHLSGGDASTLVNNSEAFEQRPSLIASDFNADANFTAGDHIFRTSHDGIGPLMNAASCQGCHLKDGRGVVPASIDSPMESMFLRISDQNGMPDAVYGDQLQTFAVQSFNTSNKQAGLPQHAASINGDQLRGEAYAYVKYETVQGQYADGESYTLRKPTYYVKDLSFGPFNDQVRLSPRVTPSLFGSGLLEAIPAENIIALADENDLNQDGISGRYSWIDDNINQQKAVGRFGYKATNPSVLQQSAGAYRGDIGITNKFAPAEVCSDLQLACQVVAEQETQTGSNLDITDRELALVEFYTRVLAVPVRRGYNADSETWQTDIQQGRATFFDIGCEQCHTARHVTGVAEGSVLGEVQLTALLPQAETLPVLSNQTIFPYTDLLLHDMGGSCSVTQELSDGTSCSEGESCQYVQRCSGLADDRPEGIATGTEWKTPALWGLGLVQVVNPQATFLHDGRARTISEAILWHGGEATQAQQAFINLSKADRDNLLRFLNSL